MGKRPSAAIPKEAWPKAPKASKSSAAAASVVAVSVKVAKLREAGYEDFEAWLQDKGNLYVGRRGRIFITGINGKKRIFHYAGSKWQNPFTVGKDLSREEACEKFRKALLDGSLKDEDTLVQTFHQRVLESRAIGVLH